MPATARLLLTVTVCTLLTLTACGGAETTDGAPAAAAPESPATESPATESASASAEPSSTSPPPTKAGTAAATPAASTAPTAPTATASDTSQPSASHPASASATTTARGAGGSPGSAGRSPSPKSDGAPAATGPSFPVPASPGNSTQLITVDAQGSYATVTAWSKGSAGWKSDFSTTAGRVGSNGVVDGSTRRQSTSTTPSGTYSITEGFGTQSASTAIPYVTVDSSHWWVQDPESKFYNSMHSSVGADFPLTEKGERGSEQLINYPTQYARALVINFNRWPAVPGRGAGIFLHVNGNGATAGCVSVPRATMNHFMSWISPASHPRIAIG